MKKKITVTNLANAFREAGTDDKQVMLLISIGGFFVSLIMGAPTLFFAGAVGMLTLVCILATHYWNYS